MLWFIWIMYHNNYLFTIKGGFMHPTAYKNCQEFYEAYHEGMLDVNADYEVIEIGAQDVNGSLRPIFPPGVVYTGIDFVEGKGVDIVLEDPYALPLASESVDMIVCSSVFEHSELFWVLYLEIMRVLKPHGIFYLNVPANGDVHRWPVDCWRFYPDSGNALVTWAKRNNMNPVLLESYTSFQNKGQWNDFVAVFTKDAAFVEKYPNRILHTKTDYWNGKTDTNPDFMKPATISEDQKRIEVMKKVASGEIAVS